LSTCTTIYEAVNIGVSGGIAASVRTKEADLSDSRPEPLADSGEKRVKRSFDYRRESHGHRTASPDRILFRRSLEWNVAHVVGSARAAIARLTPCLTCTARLEPRPDNRRL